MVTQISMNKRAASTIGGQFQTFLDQLFYCPSCTTWRLPRQLKRVPHANRTTRRHASTLTSNTAINATKPVPTQLKPLYEALQIVRRDASPYVNTSRFQLALQGLESSNPTVRLAILGLNVPDTARRIARLLQADPLENEGQWEQELIAGHQDYSKGLIIRYGRSGNSNIPRPRNSIPVLYVPAQVLEKHNVEILVSSVSGAASEDPQRPVSIPSDTFLAPVIGVPTSSDGRHTVVSQPVHKSILVVRGLDELLVASQLLASTNFDSTEDRDSVGVLVELNHAKLPKSETTVRLVDTKKAEEALAAIRVSVTRATEYEHKWIDSGMLEVSNWLTESTGSKSDPDTSLPEPVKDLMVAILKSANSSIETASVISVAESRNHDFSLSAQISLKDAIENFSRSAHQELQSGLASAWSSRNWRKLAWYKLFWRVDDVGLIVSDLVTNAWLPKTERAVYELSGRLVQVGISPVMEEQVPTAPIVQIETTSESLTNPALEPTAQLATSALAVPQTHAVITTLPTNQPKVEIQPIPQPLPIASTISQARTAYILTTMTELTTTAQQLVLRTLSITGLTAGLSSLTYFSSLSGTVYEAGTIAAVGTVFALWRMQGGWMKATKQIEDGLFAEGRSVIMDVVSRMRRLVKERAEIVGVNVEKEVHQKARDAVMKAREELEKVGGK